MPAAKQQTGIDAERLAALMASADTCNPSEAEAMNAFRAMRRMVAGNQLRLVDVWERADVKQAIDARLKPLREENSDLQEALKTAATLREELIERTRDVTRMAEALKQQEETTEALREELAAANWSGSQTRRARRSTMRASAGVSPSFGAPSWIFETAAVIAAIALLLKVLVGGRF